MTNCPPRRLHFIGRFTLYSLLRRFSLRICIRWHNLTPPKSAYLILIAIPKDILQLSGDKWTAFQRTLQRSLIFSSSHEIRVCPENKKAHCLFQAKTFDLPEIACFPASLSAEPLNHKQPFFGFPCIEFQPAKCPSTWAISGKQHENGLDNYFIRNSCDMFWTHNYRRKGWRAHCRFSEPNDNALPSLRFNVSNDIWYVDISLFPSAILYSSIPPPLQQLFSWNFPSLFWPQVTAPL